MDTTDHEDRTFLDAHGYALAGIIASTFSAELVVSHLTSLCCSLCMVGSVLPATSAFVPSTTVYVAKHFNCTVIFNLLVLTF